MVSVFVFLFPNVWFELNAAEDVKNTQYTKTMLNI